MGVTRVDGHEGMDLHQEAPLGEMHVQQVPVIRPGTMVPEGGVGVSSSR